MSHVDELQRWMLDYFCEQTGVPSDVLDPEVTLEDFLGLTGNRLAGVLADLEQRAAAPGLERYARDTSSRGLTIRALTDYIERHAKSPTNGENGHAPPDDEPIAFHSPSATPAASEEPDAATLPQLARRFVLRTLEEPLGSDLPADPAVAGAVVILGNGPVADALRDRLAPANAPVHSLAWFVDAAAMIAALDAAWEQRPVSHLLLASLPEPPPCRETGSAWSGGETAAFVAGFALVQHWLRRVEQAGLVDQAALVAVTSLGGDFGFRNPIPSPAGGAWAGLLKALHAEHDGRLTVKILDAAAGEPAKMIAAAVVRELAAKRPDVEVGCVRGRREVVRAIPQSVDALPARTLTRDAAWVVTGGATGVTARVAAELGRRFSLKLHLIGSTPAAPLDEATRSLDADGLRHYRMQVMREARAAGYAPDEAWSAVERSIEIDATLRSLSSAGVSAVYHACDVSNAAALAATLEQIRAASGPIRGVIHAAGFERPGRFVKKPAEIVARTLAAKAEGAANLLSLTANDPLEAFMAFGSLCGRFGGATQADYSAASELLSKLVAAERARRPAARLVTLDWPPWDEVGLSVRPDHRFLLDHAGVRRMPVSEGVEHLVRELLADTRDAEIVIAEHPSGPASQNPSMPSPDLDAALCKGQSQAGALPLIDDVVLRSRDSGVAAMTFDPSCDPFLTGHRDEGTPLLPAVIALEAAAEAACLLTGAPCVAEIRDIKLVQGFRMSLPMHYRADLQAERTGDAVACRLAGAYLTAEGRLADPGRIYQRMTVITANAPARLAPPPASAPSGDWTPVAYSRDWRDPPPLPLRTIFYGPALSTLKEINYGTRGAIDSHDPATRQADPAVAWGRFVAPDPTGIGGRRPGRDWKTCPALFDGALVVGNLQAVHLVGGMQLPHLIDRIRYGRPARPGEKCLAQVHFFGRHNRQYLFELWLLGEDGATLLHAEGIRFVDRTASLGPAGSSKA